MATSGDFNLAIDSRLPCGPLVIRAAITKLIQSPPREQAGGHGRKPGLGPLSTDFGPEDPARPNADRPVPSLSFAVLAGDQVSAGACPGVLDHVDADPRARSWARICHVSVGLTTALVP